MEVLLWLVIATLAVIGWLAGNLFACVFLTIATVLLFVLTATSNTLLAPASLVLLIVIWAPRWWWTHGH